MGRYRTDSNCDFFFFTERCDGHVINITFTDYMTSSEYAENGAVWLLKGKRKGMDVNGQS